MTSSQVLPADDLLVCLACPGEPSEGFTAIGESTVQAVTATLSVQIARYQRAIKDVAPGRLLLGTETRIAILDLPEGAELEARDRARLEPEVRLRGLIFDTANGELYHGTTSGAGKRIAPGIETWQAVSDALAQGFAPGELAVFCQASPDPVHAENIRLRSGGELLLGAADVVRAAALAFLRQRFAELPGRERLAFLDRASRALGLSKATITSVYGEQIAFETLEKAIAERSIAELPALVDKLLGIG